MHFLTRGREVAISLIGASGRPLRPYLALFGNWLRAGGAEGSVKFRAVRGLRRGEHLLDELGSITPLNAPVGFPTKPNAKSGMIPNGIPR